MDLTNTSLPPEFTTKIMDAVPVGIIISKKDDHIVWCNSTLTSWLDIARNNLVGTTVTTFIEQYLHTTDDKPNLFTVNDANERPVHWLQQSTLQAEYDNDTYQVVFFTDAAHQVELEDRLEQLETVEPVSGLLNRRAMMQNLEPLVSRSRRYGNPLSLIAIELLNLKDIQSQYGRDAADTAILELSHLLKDQLRWADIVSRIDDNNIIIIFPETDKSAATNLANKISHRIAALKIQHKDVSGLGLSACYGVTTWQKGNDSMLLLRSAKTALANARAKGSGSIETS